MMSWYQFRSRASRWVIKWGHFKSFSFVHVACSLSVPVLWCDADMGSSSDQQYHVTESCNHENHELHKPIQFISYQPQVFCYSNTKKDLLSEFTYGIIDNLKYVTMSDLEKLCSVLMFVRWQLSFSWGRPLIINRYFLSAGFSICFPTDPDFANVETDEDSKNLWFNIHVIFILLFSINIALPTSCRAQGH